MKTIIAGGRDFTDWVMFIDCMAKYHLPITEVVSGKAKGADRMGELYADRIGVKVAPFPALWNDLSHPDAAIRTDRRGRKYDAKAGLRRNIKMAEYAEVLIAFWDGKSSGTKHMIESARARGLTVNVINI